VSKRIERFGGGGAHEVLFGTGQGEQTVWIKRDLWFDRDDGTNWVVWAQQRSWDNDRPPSEDDAEGSTLGSIVVTHPAVMEFIDQLGKLLVNPAGFSNDPRFVEDPARVDDAE
jgi:hypothetical protein